LQLKDGVSSSSPKKALLNRSNWLRFAKYFPKNHRCQPIKIDDTRAR
jgi:hypothetical protein